MAQDAERPAKQQSRNINKESKHANGDAQRRKPTRHEESNDQATIAYIKRVLCSGPRHSDQLVDSHGHNTDGEPLTALLPPLSSSNAIDVQLYALIAVILSNFVQTWYSRISPDQQFVNEIVQIIAHCTRGLEQRLRLVDLESLLLDELSDLVAEHVKAARFARASRTENLTAGQIRARYHVLQPHVALDPVPVDVDTSKLQEENETAWCLLLANRVLPMVLPPEDLQNPCLDILVSEIFSEMIFRGGVCNKASEPWLLWDGIAKALRSIQAQKPKPLAATSSAPTSRLEDFGLVSTDQSGGGIRRARPRRRLDSISRSFWFLLQGMMMAWLLVRAIFVALMQASSTPARSSQSPLTDKKTKTTHGQTIKLNAPAVRVHDEACMNKRPIIGTHIWRCLSLLLRLDRRMPWLFGALSLLQWNLLHGPGRLGGTDSRLDRLLSSHIHRTLSNPSAWLPHVLHAARSALFPHNAPAPARMPPSPDDDGISRIRSDCAEAVVDAIPASVRARFFATDSRALMVDDVAAELGLLADSYINKHLIIRAVDLVAVRLFPELRLAGDEDLTGEKA